MRRLDVSPVEHFAATDYAGSEVLIYRWDADAGRVLVCCNDLSEKIADWAYGAGRPAYASRYRVFSFLGVGGYRRSGVRDAWRRLQDDFLITRTDRRIPLDDITVAAGDEGLAVTISFELGFGAVAFDCRRVMISELTTRAVPGSGAAPRDVVDGDGETAFDEDEFLSGLYASGPTGS